MSKKGNKFRSILALLLSLVMTMSLITGCSIETGDISQTGQNQITQISTNVEYGDGTLRVHYIDVGQADSILIQAPDGENMLIDAGETKDGAVINYINSLGITKLDKVIATHPHADHISEMPDVINKFEIGEFYMPKASNSSKIFEKMVDALTKKGISPIEGKAGVSFNMGDVKCDIVAPCSSGYKNLNDYSIVMRMSYGDRAFLFTGDAEQLSENEILSSGADISADVLKVGHHGSSSSTSVNFLKKVNPKYAVISCGKDNDYGHPHKETLQTLAGIDTYITYESGTIIFVTDGSALNILSGEATSQVSKTSNQNTKAEETPVQENKTQVTNNASVTGNKVTGTIIGNKNTKKYHTQDCSLLPDEENRVYFNSTQEADEQGFTPHKQCIK